MVAVGRGKAVRREVEAGRLVEEVAARRLVEDVVAARRLVEDQVVDVPLDRRIWR